ncbi:hypothetical protein BTHE_1992 [Bifidobacterium thermophilum]|nr:hypothetical protein BTHE_1992 [Bifidobacterium thermophilum]
MRFRGVTAGFARRATVPGRSLGHNHQSACGCAKKFPGDVQLMERARFGGAILV